MSVLTRAYIRRQPANAIAAVAAIPLLASCILQFGEGSDLRSAVVRNETGESLSIVAIDGESEYSVEEVLTPGMEGLIDEWVNDVSGCTSEAIIFVALTEAGEEVARRDEPICKDEVWTIVATDD